MKIIRSICCFAFFAWVIISLMICAFICCNEQEQTKIGRALFDILKSIGG
jgi:hypothetical protein